VPWFPLKTPIVFHISLIHPYISVCRPLCYILGNGKKRNAAKRPIVRTCHIYFIMPGTTFVSMLILGFSSKSVKRVRHGYVELAYSIYGYVVHILYLVRLYNVYSILPVCRYCVKLCNPVHGPSSGMQWPRGSHVGKPEIRCPLSPIISFNHARSAPCSV